MSKSIQFENNTYIDSTGVTHKRQPLSEILEVEDFKNQISFNEEPGNFLQFKKIGDIVIIAYQGAIKTHQTDEVIFKIPTKYAPKTNNVGAPFAQYAGAYGQILIKTNGDVQVNIISSSSVSGRIVFNAVYVI